MTRRLAASTLAAFCLAASQPALAKDQAAEAPAVRQFTFTYKVTVPKPADGAKRLDAWIPTPLTDDVQHVTDLVASATMDGHSVPVDLGRDKEYGNGMVHVGVDNPKSDVVMQWTANIARTADVGQGKGAMNPRFLESDNLVPLKGAAEDIAKQLGVDKEDAALEGRVRKIYDEVLTTMQYDKVADGWGRGDFQRACTVGKGNCTDFHAKFTGIARASHIPVRFTMGIPLKTDAGGAAEGYHCWAHWRDGREWKPVDISEAQKILAKDPAKADWFFGHLDPDRLALTVGRDLTLVPPQSGKPLLFFAYPYVEVDGVETKDPNAKANRSFTWKNLPSQQASAQATP
jgi:transglutaminase-like putative cysteine protease